MKASGWLAAARRCISSYQPRWYRSASVTSSVTNDSGLTCAARNDRLPNTLASTYWMYSSSWRSSVRPPPLAGDP